MKKKLTILLLSLLILIIIFNIEVIIRTFLPEKEYSKDRLKEFINSYYFKESNKGIDSLSDLIKVPEGDFLMGWDGIVNTKPVHKVKLDEFYVSKYEVTRAEWDFVLKKNKKNKYSINVSGNNMTRQPITDISWYDAVKWCNLLSEVKKLKPCYYTNGSKTEVYRKGEIDLSNDCVDWNANGYRLPTEAEWEYAARYINGVEWRMGDKYSGSDNLDEVGWYQKNTETIKEVGLLKPNQLGIYDMSGNAHEWCWDWYAGGYNDEENNPKGFKRGKARVYRGGTAYYNESSCAVCYRGSFRPVQADGTIGFRVVRKIK